MICLAIPKSVELIYYIFKIYNLVRGKKKTPHTLSNIGSHALGQDRRCKGRNDWEQQTSVRRTKMQLETRIDSENEVRITIVLRIGLGTSHSPGSVPRKIQLHSK